MAQQLQKQGHEVALLAILDMHAQFPRQPRGADWDDATWISHYAYFIEYFFGKNLDMSYEVLQPLTIDEQLNYCKEQLQKVNLLPPSGGIKLLRAHLEVWKASYLTYYAPTEVWKTPITLFRARESQPEDAPSDELSEILQDPTWGWNKFSTDPVEVHFVPGDHITMMANPHVQVLAERLLVSLDQII